MHSKGRGGAFLTTASVFDKKQDQQQQQKSTSIEPVPISLQGLGFEELRKMLPPSKSLSLTGALLRAQHLQKTINISHTTPTHTTSISRRSE